MCAFIVFFFFFKQKRAYDCYNGFVGSGMCKRERKRGKEEKKKKKKKKKLEIYYLFKGAP